MTRPLLTIGVTTYDRVEMLRECLRSILSQDVESLEVLVSNDNPSRKIGQILPDELKDPRVRCIDQDPNLGEAKNMNFLLAQARGEYFTWLADDDAFHPRFLEVAVRTINENPGLDVFFAEFDSGPEFHPQEMPSGTRGQVVPGREFLDKYLHRKISVLGCYGIFQIDFLRKIGGIPQLGQGFSPYSDTALTVRSAMAGKMVYTTVKGIFYRIHPAQISVASGDIPAYSTAQADFCAIAEDVFTKIGAGTQRDLWRYLLLKRFVADIISVFFRRVKAGAGSWGQWVEGIGQYIRQLSLRRKVMFWTWAAFCFCWEVICGLKKRLKCSLMSGRMKKEGIHANL